MDEEDRKAFERWASHPGMNPDYLRRGASGQYVLAGTYLAYRTWQAACAWKEEEAARKLSPAVPDDVSDDGDNDLLTCSVCFSDECNGECMGE